MQDELCVGLCDSSGLRFYEHGFRFKTINGGFMCNLVLGIIAMVISFSATAGVAVDFDSPNKLPAAKTKIIKNPGDAVCIDGDVRFNNMSTKIETTVGVKGFVEAVSGKRIQIRIAAVYTGRYYITLVRKGIALEQGSIIWDDHNNWAVCS